MTAVRRRHAEPLADREEIAARLRAEGHTFGRTRLAILDEVLRRDDGFSAEELAASLPGVHRATVYRTLALLEEIDVVRHVHLSHGPAMYVPSTLAETTCQIVCELCGRHRAVPRAELDALTAPLLARYGFALAGDHFALVGRCTDCSSADTERFAAGDH